MRKRIWELGMTILLLSGVFILGRSGAAVAIHTVSEDKPVVFVDPGHGGRDPGKIGVHGEKEKEINLQIGMKVKEKLEKEGVKVVMSREEDIDLAPADTNHMKAQDLKGRCSQIEEVKPDCVVSIHQNSYQDEGVKGAQVFYYETSQKGKELAEILQSTLIKTLDPENNRKAKGNTTYYLLKKVAATIVIVECGFLSNEAESNLLSQETYQEKVAEAVCEGTLEYLKKNVALNREL